LGIRIKQNIIKGMVKVRIKNNAPAAKYGRGRNNHVE